MLPPGIDPRLIAHNTPPHRTILRTLRIARQNYAQCFEAGLEDGGILSKNGAKGTLIDRPYRRFSHGWGWDPYVAVIRGFGLDHAGPQPKGPATARHAGTKWVGVRAGR